MKTKQLLFLSLTTLLLFLSGCTHEANRIYTICEYGHDGVYCYDINENFYQVYDDGSLIQVSSVGLKAYPALSLTPTAGNYEFENVMPGLYRGTLTSVNHYVSTLCNDSGYYDVVFADPNNLELYVYTETYNVRIIYNIRGEVRLYAIDKSDNFIEPPYLNEK